MFITFLRFSRNRTAAPELMAAHNEWIAKGFADGVIVGVGSLMPAAGGTILAYGESRKDHERRLAADPFVAQGVVTPETYEVDLKRTIPAFDFLKAPT